MFSKSMRYNVEKGKVVLGRDILVIEVNIKNYQK